MSERNNHRHGRWTGLFKLSEEAGELIVAAVDLLFAPVDSELPAAVRALEDELADVGAACRHAIEANGLDRERVDARIGRLLSLASARRGPGGWCGLLPLIRRAGSLQQLLGKIAAFPDGNEHPDGGGNLKGRLEAAIADLAAACRNVAAANDLDLDHIEARGDDKIDKFRSWFPASESAGLAATAEMLEPAP